MPTPAVNAWVVTFVAAVDPKNVRGLTRQLSYGGLLTALVILLLAVKMLLPTADLAILALTSLCMAIAVIEMGVRPAFVTFAAAALLSIAWPGLAVAFPFVLFFGPYPLVRAVIDRRFGRLPAALLKLAAGNGLTAAAVLLFAWPEVVAASERIPLFWFLLPVALQAVLLIFDLALSLLIQFYMTRIRRKP